MTDERRRAERVRVSASFSESDPHTTTPVANLSRTGALVVNTPLLPVGSRIELRFMVFPDQPMLFQHTGRVVRHRHQPVAMGVEFDPMSPELEALLDGILERASEIGRRRRRRGRRFMLDAHQLRVRRIDE